MPFNGLGIHIKCLITNVNIVYVSRLSGKGPSRCIGGRHGGGSRGSGQSVVVKVEDKSMVEEVGATTIVVAVDVAVADHKVLVAGQSELSEGGRQISGSGGVGQISGCGGGSQHYGCGSGYRSG
jgi:hypothetical protein